MLILRCPQRDFQRIRFLLISLSLKGIEVPLDRDGPADVQSGDYRDLRLGHHLDEKRFIFLSYKGLCVCSPIRAVVDIAGRRPTRRGAPLSFLTFLDAEVGIVWAVGGLAERGVTRLCAGSGRCAIGLGCLNSTWAKDSFRNGDEWDRPESVLHAGLHRALPTRRTAGRDGRLRPRQPCPPSAIGRQVTPG